MTPEEQAVDVAVPGEDVETNGSDALRPVHELEADSASTVVDWLISDQKGETTTPAVDDVIETIESAPVAVAFRSSKGFGYATKTDVGADWLHYREITDKEQIADVATVEQRSKDDVRYTRRVVDDPTVRNWVHLSIDTGELELVSTEQIDVFDDPSAYERGSGE